LINPERWKRIESLFWGALALEAHARASFLDGAIGADSELKGEVELLLRSHDAAGGFLPTLARCEPSPSLAGRMIGDYQVEGLIGRGGMGAVFRARDRRLKRDVAIKVLPDHVSRDQNLVLRFQREAETLASLNHPHIAAIYDILEIQGSKFLVLEYVDGETLADRIKRGPVPVGEAIQIALQITAGLEAAHEKGIVHRDLKPANIKRTREGHVKVLDFGIARISSRLGMDADTSTLPTETALSMPGALLGTPAYMSPEQATGGTAERASDVWAFGCVLFELISGHPAFPGRTIAETLAEVLKAEPDWASLPAETPSAVRHVLRRCLQKDVRSRFHDIADVRIALEDMQTEAGTLEQTATAPAANRWLRLVTFALAIVTLAATVPAILYFRRSSGNVAAPVSQFEIAVTMREAAAFSISPNSRYLAYVAPDSDNTTAIWIRPLSELQASKLPGTAGTTQPDWSHDSRSVIFPSGGKLKKVDITGGSSQTLLDFTQGMPVNRSTSNSDGVILVGNRVLRRVSVAGSDSANETELPPGPARHYTPWFLPDGLHYLYTEWTEKPEERALYVSELGSTTRKRLMNIQSKAIYSAGYLLFANERALVARPFNLDKLEFTGDPVVVVGDIAHDPNNGLAAFGASLEGTLVYRRGELLTDGARQFFLVDRDGNRSQPIESVLGLTDVRLDPDGKRAAFNLGVIANTFVTILDLDRRLKTQVTPERVFGGYGIWSPDGSRVVFAKGKDNALAATELFERPSNLTAPARRLLSMEDDAILYARDWSRDGKAEFSRSSSPRKWCSATFGCFQWRTGEKLSLI